MVVERPGYPYQRLIELSIVRFTMTSLTHD